MFRREFSAAIKSTESWKSIKLPNMITQKATRKKGAQRKANSEDLGEIAYAQFRQILPCSHTHF